MQVLGWLLIPLAATILGLVWAMWRSREPKPADAEQGMEDLARFRQAMEKPMPPSGRLPARSGAADEAIDPDPGR